MHAFFIVYRTYPDRDDRHPVATFSTADAAIAYLNWRLNDEPWLEDYLVIGIVKEWTP